MAEAARGAGVVGPLAGKALVLGVSGSVAAYKAVDLASKLTQEGAKVDVVMTLAGTRFVAPLNFRSVTGRAVTTDLFDPGTEHAIEHISLAQSADLVAIAPATANIIAKLAAGIADDIVTCTVLATTAPVLIAPAMNVNMWENGITQENVARLRRRGLLFVGPGHGWLAEGRTGYGRMAEPAQIVDAIKQALGRKGDLAEKHVVVTAGGTQEPIDPVRHVGNRSSGKMGYALAEAARDRGARVTLISASVALPEPVGVSVVNVRSSEEMYAAVASTVSGADVLLMAAAVADYRPAQVSTQKIKKDQPRLVLELVKTRDILQEVTGSFMKVGFAAESADLIANAEKKLKAKGLDLIVANDITSADSGFGSDMNRVVILGRDGEAEEVPLLPKRQVADRVLDRVAALLRGRGAASAQ